MKNNKKAVETRQKADPCPCRSHKALFLDLDGTLLTDQKELTSGNYLAVQKALSLGHQIIIATGRPLASAILQAEALGLTGDGCYLIAYNGCTLYDSYRKRTIFSTALPLDLVCRVFEEAKRQDIHIHAYDEDAVVVEPRCDTPVAEEYCRRIQMKCKVIPDIHELKRNPEKLLIVDYERKEPLDRFREWIACALSDRLDSYYSSEHYVEIVPKGMTKGGALRQMAACLQIPMENTIAAGDAANDLSMLEAAAIGVAMKNAAPEVKAAADYITKRDNNHDGIAELIERYLL